MALDVPFFKQDTAYSCGAASVQMMLAYFGIHRSEHALMDRLHTDRLYGTHHRALLEVFAHEGLYTYVNESALLDELRFFIHERMLPCLVHYIEPDADEGHYAVVVGVDYRHVTLNDPWNGPAFLLTVHEFESRWHNERNEFSHWFLTASKDTFQLGRQYVPAPPTSRV